MIHACGIVDNAEHSVDDVFSWPQLRMGARPSDDRLATLRPKNVPIKGSGNPPRMGYGMMEMPPIFLKRETADKVRALWA